jgi:hypothetical protein
MTGAVFCCAVFHQQKFFARRNISTRAAFFACIA